MVATMAGQSLRSAVDVLRAAGELVTVDREIDADFEMTAILERGGTGPRTRSRNPGASPSTRNRQACRCPAAMRAAASAGESVRHRPE